MALPALGLAAAATSIVIAASWYGTAWTVGAVLGLLPLAAGLLCLRRLNPLPISALRTAAEAERWQVRLPDGWRDAVLVDQWRGPTWLSLTLRSLPRAGRAVHDRQVTFTLWRSTLPPDCWRRLCWLAGATRRGSRTVRSREAA